MQMINRSTNNRKSFIKDMFDSDIFLIALAGITITAVLIAIYLCISTIGGHISTGSGEYSGILVETRRHGIIWKTNGAHFKTGENSSSFEDFCVDDAVFAKVQTLVKDKPVTVKYIKKLATPPWRCDSRDSSDIIIEVIQK